MSTICSDSPIAISALATEPTTVLRGELVSDLNIAIDPADDVSMAKVRRQTDKYFTRTARMACYLGNPYDVSAVSLRGPALAAFRRATGFIVRAVHEQGIPVEITNWIGQVTRYVPKKQIGDDLVKILLPFPEGDKVAAGQPMIYTHGPVKALAELETGTLARLGGASVDALNAYDMCVALPKVPFIDMSARHCEDGSHNSIAYGTSVGSRAAQADYGAKGFIGSSTDETAHWFGAKEGMGSMPHRAIKMCGSTLKAAEVYYECFPDLPLIVLVDYFGKEVTDSLEVAARFTHLAKQGKLYVRLDTHGGRYMEGLDLDKSHAVIQRYAPHMLKQNLTDKQYKMLVKEGVSVAAVWFMREQLDRAGYRDVKILASSGFTPEKCRLFAAANAPVDMIGTGSHLPATREETFFKQEALGSKDDLGPKVGRGWTLHHFRRDAAQARFTL